MNTIKEVQDHIVSKAAGDDAFRDSLISNPRGAIEKELGVAIPDSFTIHVHEDSLTTSNLVLPPKNVPVEMTEKELAGVVGGTACNNPEHDDYDQGMNQLLGRPC